MILILIVYQNSKDRGKMLQRQNAKLNGQAPRRQRYLGLGAVVDKNIKPVAVKSEVTCSRFLWSEESSRS